MNEKLQERLPEIIKAVRSLVARASIECRLERYTEDVEEWFNPFEDLDYAEYQIRTKLREHE